ncbi:hypothetical protein QNM99_10245 [Pseudomonas sp. PCH446]
MKARYPGLALLLLAGCSFIPDYRQPSPTVAEYWRDAGRRRYRVVAGLARSFSRPELQALIELARTHNRDLQVAVLRIDEARALYGISAADQWPGGASTARYSGRRFPRRTRLPARR